MLGNDLHQHLDHVKQMLVSCASEQNTSQVCIYRVFQSLLKSLKSLLNIFNKKT